MPRGSSSPFEVVVVCTGNRFRSPLFAGLLERRTADLPVEVRSVGILDLEGAPALPEAVELAPGLGLDLEPHRTRSLAGGSVADADLVLGFERIHVATACVDGRAPRARAFTVLELLGLLREVDPPDAAEAAERARASIGAAAALRERLGKPAPELEDPLGRGLRFMRRQAGELAELADELAARLFG